MEQVKRLIAAGASISGAIREALSQKGLTVATLADRYGRDRANIASVISGGRRPTEADLDAFVQELGGTRDEWTWLLYDAARPAVPRPCSLACTDA